MANRCCARVFLVCLSIIVFVFAVILLGVFWDSGSAVWFLILILGNSVSLLLWFYSLFFFLLVFHYALLHPFWLLQDSWLRYSVLFSPFSFYFSAVPVDIFSSLDSVCTFMSSLSHQSHSSFLLLFLISDISFWIS
jgi:hypothetical protein